jgi:hypothetical protein
MSDWVKFLKIFHNIVVTENDEEEIQMVVECLGYDYNQPIITDIPDLMVNVRDLLIMEIDDIRIKLLEIAILLGDHSVRFPGCSPISQLRIISAINQKKLGKIKWKTPNSMMISYRKSTNLNLASARIRRELLQCFIKIYSNILAEQEEFIICTKIPFAIDYMKSKGFNIIDREHEQLVELN